MREADHSTPRQGYWKAADFLLSSPPEDKCLGIPNRKVRIQNPNKGGVAAGFPLPGSALPAQSGIWYSPRLLAA